MEATILKWHKQPGDSVKMDETVLEIATDKVDSEAAPLPALSSYYTRSTTLYPSAKSSPGIRTGCRNSIPASARTSQAGGHHAGTAPGHNPGFPSHERKRFFTPLFYSPGFEYRRQRRHQSFRTGEIPGSGNEGRVTKKISSSTSATENQVPAC